MTAALATRNTTLAFFYSLLLALPLRADILTLTDGTVQSGVFARSEGIRLLVWDSLDAVGGPAKVLPASRVKNLQRLRDASWDAHVPLPDLSVTFIEMNPKLAGLHGVVQYDTFGRPVLGGAAALSNIGERAALEPEVVAAPLRLAYQPGETIALTAHVKNVGFKPAAPFQYEWLIDKQKVADGTCAKVLGEMEETTFALPWKWQAGCHHVTFKVITDQKEISINNNSGTDPLWAWGYVFIADKSCVAAWHQIRTSVGTFSFEDYYRWHVDVMNTLFQASIFPAAPEGIKARVRLDRIVYADDVEKERNLTSPDGISYCQGAWSWGPVGKIPEANARDTTEWSLPHELGHQLGLTDWYFLDYSREPSQPDGHSMPDNGDQISHFMTHPGTMMHWHGDNIFSEVDAGYFNMTWDKPRGYFGDYYFAIPREIFLRITDVNGQAVPDAKIEIFQRGCAVAKDQPPGEDHGVKYFPVIEDGDWSKPVSKDPVIVGTTDASGLLRLPNRPVKEVRTLNGFHRQPNPFGNINVCGERGDMLVQVTKYNRPCWYWIEIYDVGVAWFRGQKDRLEFTYKTPYGSTSSPLPPANVKAVQADENHVTVTWSAPPVKRERQYLDRAIGYRVYRRISSDGLNERPWQPVATLNPETFECTVDLKASMVEDCYWFSKANRFAVSSIGEAGLESELVETLPAPKQ